MDIGDRIRAARRSVGWTQERLAQAVGVNKSAVAQWESQGTSRRGITTDNLRKVAAVLGMKLSEFLGDDADGLHVTDSSEIALVELFRRMPPRDRDVYLNLFYIASPGERVQAPRNPGKRRKVVG